MTNLVYTHGYKQIPANFYKRAIGNENTAVLVFEDSINFAKGCHEMFSIGDNTRTVDSYADLDLDDFTGGIYNSANLLEGNNIWCFVFKAFIPEAPDVLKGGYSDPSGPMSTLLDSVNTLIGNFACPKIEKLNEDRFRQYPRAPGSSNSSPNIL